MWSDWENGTFALPSGTDFCRGVVEGLMARAQGQPPEALPAVTIYVNAGRTLNTLRSAFDGHAQQHGPLLLPRLTDEVADVRVIEQAKTNTLYFKANPMDALYFTVLSAAAETMACQRVINGSPLHESVNHYKRQFLFQAIEFPIYSSNAWLVEMAKRLKEKGRRRPLAQE